MLRTPFKPTCIQETSKALVKHVNDLATYIFSKYPQANELVPYIIEYRLSNLIRHVFWFEMFALLAPEDIRMDMLSLFKSQNFFMYASYFLPCGFTNGNWDMIKDGHLGFGTMVYPNSKHSLAMYKFFTKVYHDIVTDRNSYYKSNTSRIQQVVGFHGDKYKGNEGFIETWSNYLSEPARSDTDRRD